MGQSFFYLFRVIGQGQFLSWMVWQSLLKQIRSLKFTLNGLNGPGPRCNFWNCIFKFNCLIHVMYCQYNRLTREVNQSLSRLLGDKSMLLLYLSIMVGIFFSHIEQKKCGPRSKDQFFTDSKGGQNLSGMKEEGTRFFFRRQRWGPQPSQINSPLPVKI